MFHVQLINIHSKGKIPAMACSLITLVSTIDYPYTSISQQLKQQTEKNIPKVTLIKHVVL